MFMKILVIVLLNIISSLGSKNLKEEENVMLNDLLLDLDAEDNHLYDPNDMLAAPKIDPSVKKKNIHAFDDGLREKEGSCAFENMKVGKCSQELEDCSTKLEESQSQIKKEKKSSALLLQKLSNCNNIDSTGFYIRILRKFWGILGMEENEKYLQGSNDAFVKHLVVRFTASDISAFKETFSGGDAHNQVDVFFANNFEIKEMEETDVWMSIKEKFLNMYSQFQSFELWLTMFWGLIILLFVWMFYLFILDIQKELRWKRVFMMVLVLAFLVSYIYHWRHMIKVRESQRHSLITKMELDDRMTGCMKEDSLWSLIKVNVFGAQSDCEKYHEKIMIPAAEEISPMMVLSETVSNFILHPLKDLGHHCGLFFANFYKNIPLFWQLPATLVFLLMVGAFLFTFFGYGIYFPFWLGGIRPSREEDNSDKLKLLMKESEESLKSINAAMINEAKEMLTQISQVAITQAQNSSSQPYAEAIVQKSTTFIEKKLEDLINRKLSSALNLHSSSLTPPISSVEYEQRCIEAGSGSSSPKIMMDDVVDWRSTSRARPEEEQQIISATTPIPIPWKREGDRYQRRLLEETTVDSLSPKKRTPLAGNECSARSKRLEVLDDDDFISKVKDVLGDG